MNGINKIKIRLVRADDALKLSEIYRPYVENTAVSFEYTAPDEEEFLERIESKMVSYPFLIAEYEGEVAGYAYASPFLPRPAYKHSVETTIYLRQDLKGKGIGRKLYEALEAILKIQNVLSINACIAVTSAPDATLTNASVDFHSRMGFRYVGIFNCSGYKFDRFYDMIWMEKLILTPTEPFADFVPFSQIIQEANKILSLIQD